MKQLFWVAALAFTAISCGNDTTDNAATAETTTTEGQQTTVDAAVVLDPVCKMEKTDQWTETSVTHGETYYFCSPVCKEQFEKDPHKYLPDHQH